MSLATAEARFQTIYGSYRREVLAYFLRRTHASSAADGAAETFLVVWRRIDEVPAGDGTLPWLYGVARLVLANQLRSRRRRGALTRRLRGSPPVDSNSPEAVVVRRAEDEELMRAIRRLRPIDQEVLLLAYWEELPHEQIGVVVGVSAHAVAQRIYRIKKTLARELTRSEPQPINGRANG